MFERAAFLGFVCFFLSLSPAWGQDDYRFSSFPNPNDPALLHGYAPKPFSQADLNNYWITPEDAGHYISGRSRFSDFSSARSVSSYTAVEAVDTTRVLVAPARVHLIEKAAPAAVSPSAHRPTRFNDSLDLPQIIKEHAWILPPNLQNQ